MHAIRSVLWIGPATGLAESGALDQPTLDVTWVPDVTGALTLAPSSFDVEILDCHGSQPVPNELKRLRGGALRSPILARLPAAALEAREETLAAGAREVIYAEEPGDSPPRVQELLDCINRLAEGCPWQGSSSPNEPELAGVVGRSPALREVLALVQRARSSLATVLISGETGTGKEVIARGIHETGPRATKPFVAVNCAAFPDSLLESELFGHVRGAFTGADRDKPGLFAEAHGGTVFLDEIGETSGPLQATLLRVLQEREIRPVGSSRTRPIDVRVIAATNRSLRNEAARGFFREDLYYRLAVFPITVPPLRSRREDVLALAEHFLELHGRREGKEGCCLSRPANILEPIQDCTRVGDTLRDNMNRIEAWLIRRALEQHGQRRTATARKLGITREGLYKKMKRLGVE
jgi:transcriptional regulator with PAS, ATPase and Fis domain